MGRRKLESNVVEIKDNLVYIHLQGKNGIGKVAKTDLRSFLKYGLANYVWLGGKGVPGCSKRQGYAFAWDSETKRCISMHRLISENTSRLHTDHISGYTLDNRESNLRICNAKHNNYNTGTRCDNKTGFKNTHVLKGKYICNIKIDGVKRYFGSYDKPEMSGLAYNIAMEFIAPKYAQLNVIPEGALTEEEVQHVHKTVNRMLEKIYGKVEDSISEVV